MAHKRPANLKVRTSATAHTQPVSVHYKKRHTQQALQFLEVFDFF